MSGPDPKGAAGRGITLYDIIGVLSGATAETIERAYESKRSLLRPELISGAPSNVVTVASRAREILDAAWRVLSDPVNRERYDVAAGFRRPGEGLVRTGAFPPTPGGNRQTSISCRACRARKCWAP